MLKKIIISIFIFGILVIFAINVVKKLNIDKSSVELRRISNNKVDEEIVIQNKIDYEETLEDITQEKVEESIDTTVILPVEEESEITKNNEERETNKSKSEEKKVPKKEEIITTTIKENEIVQENTKVEDEINVENTNEPKEEVTTEKVESTKEIIEYNDAETKRVINDIHTIAKQNEYLWDKDGNPLYQVEISPDAMNGEYMYPYRIELVEGKVLNVFSVKFLVYVVDVERPGFEKEMKYYISITNYEN